MTDDDCGYNNKARNRINFHSYHRATATRVARRLPLEPVSWVFKSENYNISYILIDFVQYSRVCVFWVHKHRRTSKIHVYLLQ